MSNTQKLQIKSTIIERFKAFTDYDRKLLKYAAAAYVECIGNKIKLMTKKGVEANFLILAQVKKSYCPSVSPSRTIIVELPEANPTTGDG